MSGLLAECGILYYDLDKPEDKAPPGFIERKYRWMHCNGMHGEGRIAILQATTAFPQLLMRWNRQQPGVWLYGPIG